MKRKLCALMAAILAMSSLAGCGGGNETADSGVDVVRVWSGDGGGRTVWEELVTEFNETTGKEKGIKIEWTTIMDQQQVQVAYQNGQLPEIVACTNQDGKKMAATGDILPLEDFEGGKELLDEYDTIEQVDFNVYDGKIYGLISGCTVAGLIYNKDLFKQAGIVDENGEAKPPKTVDEMVEAGKKITALGNDIYGYAFPLKFSTYYTMTMPFATSYKNLNGTKYDFDNKTVDRSEIKGAWETMLKLKDAGVCFPGAESLDNDTARAYFAEGKIGMFPAISWDVGVFTTQFIAKCDWDVAPYPTLTGEKVSPTFLNIGGGYKISKNAKKIPDEKIIEVYRFMTSLKTRATMFERGISLSDKTDVLDVADTSKLDPRFVKFQELVDEDFQIRPEVRYTVEDKTDYFMKAWLGEMTLDEAFDTSTKVQNEAFKKAIESGELDVEFLKQYY